MKKKYLFLTMAMAAALFAPSMTAMAGNINSAEQGILDALSCTYEYNGAYYRVSDGYYSQVSEYFCKDEVDLTDAEATSYLNQFYSNIGTGIASGYMVKVGDVKQPSADSGNQSSGQQGESQTTEGESQTTAGEGQTTEETSSADQSGSTDTAAAQQTTDQNDTAKVVKIPDDKNGNQQTADNTAGSTQSGKIDYTVAEMEAVMYVWDVEELEVHAEAYKDSEVIGTLHKGDEVQVTGAATTGWAQISFEDGTGYVSAAYLRTDGYVEQQTAQEEEKASAEDIDAADDAAEELTEEAEDTADETEQEDGKDYSDAEAPAASFSMGWFAVIVMGVIVIAAVLVVLIHRRKKQ